MEKTTTSTKHHHITGDRLNNESNNSDLVVTESNQLDKSSELRINRIGNDKFPKFNPEEQNLSLSSKRIEEAPASKRKKLNQGKKLVEIAVVLERTPHALERVEEIVKDNPSDIDPSIIHSFKKRRKKWSPEEIEKLKSLLNKNKTRRQISQKLNRPLSSISVKLEQLNLRNPSEKTKEKNRKKRHLEKTNETTSSKRQKVASEKTNNPELKKLQISLQKAKKELEQLTIEHQNKQKKLLNEKKIIQKNIQKKNNILNQLNEIS
jgi:hypothetical protein